MKILACFKIVCDFERITPAELTALQEGSLNLSVFKRIFGSYDEAALENARRLAEEIRKTEDCKLDAVTVGDCEPRFLKNLYALGFDEVFKVRGEKDAAANICRLAEDVGGYDMIFTGRQAWPNERGLTPYLIAKKLSLPCISNVIDLTRTLSGVRVVSKTDYGAFTRTVTSPAVYSMGEAAHPYLHIATLREKLAAESKSVSEIDIAAADMQVHTGEFLRFVYEHTEKQCRFIEGETDAQKAHALWQEVFTK